MLTIVNDGDALAAVRAFASAIPRGSWFAACGEALTAGEQADAAAYLAALGMPDITIAGVAGWRRRPSCSAAPPRASARSQCSPRSPL